MKTEAKIVARFTDTENGVESRVALRADGQFATTLYDLDAEEYIPTIYVFPGKDAAIDFASSLLDGNVNGCWAPC